MSKTQRIWLGVAAWAVYTLWFIGPGPFGELTRTMGYAPLQARGFYTGEEAVTALRGLSADGRSILRRALLFDLPYMASQAWMFWIAMRFGLRQLGAGWGSRVLWLAPAFFVFDLAEGSLIALTLSTESQVLGGAAGVATVLKFATFIPAILMSTGLLVCGAVVWVRLRGQGGATK